MKLTYRGVQYDADFTPVDTAETQLTGKYRGQSFHFAYPRHIPVEQPAFSLKYRGRAYQTAGTESVGASVSVPKTATQEVFAQTQVRRQARQAIMGEVARIHQENIQRRLQHRLEVARERGDQSLINQLEREMQLFA